MAKRRVLKVVDLGSIEPMYAICGSTVFGVYMQCPACAKEALGDEHAFCAKSYVFSTIRSLPSSPPLEVYEEVSDDE